MPTCMPRLLAAACRADAFEAPLEEVCGLVQQAALAEQRRLAAAAAQLSQHVAGLLQAGMMTTVMTCSLSSSVLAAVTEAAGARLRQQLAAGPCARQLMQQPTAALRPPAAAQGMKLRAIVCESR